MIKITKVNLRKDTRYPRIKFDFLPTMTLLAISKSAYHSSWMLCLHWLWYGIHIKNHIRGN